MYKTENTAFISAIAIDMSSEEKTRYTVTVADEEEKGDGVFETSNILYESAPSLKVAFGKLKTSSEITPFFGHASYLLLGSDNGFKNLSESLDYFLKNPEFKLSSTVFLTKNMSAGEFLEASSKSAPLMSYLDTLSANLEKEYFYRLPSIADLLKSTYNPLCATFIPILTLSDHGVKISGAAYFLNGEFKDEISSKNYDLLNLLLGNSKNIIVDLSEYESGFSLKILKSSLSLDVSKKEAPDISICFNVIAEIPHDQDIEKAKEILLRYLKSQGSELLRYQKDTSSDLFGVLDKLSKENPEVYELIKDSPEKANYSLSYAITLNEVKENA